MPDPHSLEDIRVARERLGDRIVETPVVALASDRIRPHLPDGTRAVMKLELFQQAGSFKARGALLNLDALDEAQLHQGVTTLSAGNHALALSYAARKAGVSAKVVMPRHADPIRIAGCRALGADIVLTDTIADAVREVGRIRDTEARALIHPFDSPITVLGTATCGFEFATQAPDLDAVIIPVGGGGLIAGVARAVKLLQPSCTVIGVEPEGADAMHRSFAAGGPVTLDRVDTIADSLGAPMTLPYSLGEVRRHTDALVRVSDDDMRRAMAVLFDACKIAVEPAGAASTAALMGPLAERLAGKRVGLIACGSNIGERAFAEAVARGRADPEP